MMDRAERINQNVIKFEVRPALREFCADTGSSDYSCRQTDKVNNIRRRRKRVRKNGGRQAIRRSKKNKKKHHGRLQPRRSPLRRHLGHDTDPDVVRMMVEMGNELPGFKSYLERFAQITMGGKEETVKIQLRNGH